MTMSGFLYTACAAVYLILAVRALAKTRVDHTRFMLAGCCLVTVLWAASEAWGAPRPSLRLSSLLELVQAAAWCCYIMSLYRRAVPNGARLGWQLSAMGVVTSLAIGITIAAVPDSEGNAAYFQVPLSLGIETRLLLAVCMILLIENLYRNAVEDLRWHVTLPCVALGGLFVYDLVLFSDAVLFQRISPALLDGRAVVTMFVAPLLALSARRNRRRWGGSIQVSHKAVFYSASLLVIGVFLVALASTGEILRRFDTGQTGDWATVVEVSLVCGGILVAALFLTSGSARSNLRHLVIKHFLSRRYDYRIEWLRCIKTLSHANGDVALHIRAIKAVAQTVDSPGGMFFLRDSDNGLFRPAGSWNLPTATVPILSTHPLIPLFRAGNWVVEAPKGMPWTESGTELWLAIPLSHAGRLLGFVLVSRPRAPLVLDSEVYDLLRIIGQEVASYIAEQHATEALLEAHRLKEYGQRFAFVAHDIKNVASQLSLLLANAECHIANPEFQQDMLGTVRASVQKITALLARLKAPQAAAAPAVLLVRDRLMAVIQAHGPGRRAQIDVQDNLPPGPDVAIAMEAAAFEAAVTHLLDNAFEASPPDARVQVACNQAGGAVLIDIIDHGCGMTTEFINEQLFRPFHSSKREGFGIGVYQVRELVRRAGGDLVVTSTLGFGTIMRLSLQRVPQTAAEPMAMQATP